MAKRLKPSEVKALDIASEMINRASKPVSNQPRFDPKISSTALYFQVYNWAKELIYDEPKYRLDTRKRDEWLRRVVVKEPYLLGILQSVSTIDKNRGWSIIGGKTQVNKFTNVLHNFQSSADTHSWRSGMNVTSESYYTSDLGGIVEIGRTEKNGALAGLFTVDSTKCVLTGNSEFPIRYYAKGAGQNWSGNDYFRITSFPSTDENMNGIGLCAISRCIELAKLLVGVFEHDREKLGTKAPKGLLLLNGITQQQWLTSLEESSAELDSLERMYYSGVQVLAGDGLSNIEAKMVSLSSLPETFDHKQFIDMLIYGYALAFGYDPREFWPVSGGQLGTSTETETQHKKATGKGGLDFILGFQEKLQEELPETIDFEFEQRDTDGEISDTSLQQQKLNIINALYSSANTNGENLITLLEARQLLAEAKLIPDNWTLPEENVTLEDTEDTGTLIEKERVKKALERFPNEPLVRYTYPENVTREIILPKKKFQVRVKKKNNVLYKNGSVVITEQDVNFALKEAQKRLGKRTDIYNA